MDAKTLSADELIALLGITGKHPRRTLSMAVARGVAPKPLPMVCAQRRWSRAVVDHWLATNGGRLLQPVPQRKTA